MIIMHQNLCFIRCKHLISRYKTSFFSSKCYLKVYHCLSKVHSYVAKVHSYVAQVVIDWVLTKVKDYSGLLQISVEVFLSEKNFHAFTVL